MEHMITLEVTDHCNLSCSMCVQGKSSEPHGMPKGLMSLETWKAFVDSLEHFEPTVTITPFWVGESFLNPQFLDMMEYAFNNNSGGRLFDVMAINTNGVLVTKDASARLLKLAALKDQDESTLRRIHFSVDAINPDTFFKLKGKRLLDVVNQNIIEFLNQRKQMGLHYPNVTLALIVTEDTKGEAREFLEYWRKILLGFNKDIEITHDWPSTRLDSIYIRRLDDWNNQEAAERLHKEVVEDLGIVSHKEERIIRTNSVLGFEKESVRRPCPGPWRTPIIHRNGDVSVCCFDISMANVIGNVNATPLYKLWNSELINKWRLAHVLGEFENAAPLCKSCGNLFGPVLTDEMVVEWLKKSGNGELAPGFMKRIGPQKT